MAEVNKVIKTTTGLNQNKPSSDVKKVDTPIKSDELINNTEENKEDTNEIAQEKADTQNTTEMVVVTYVGNSIYKDEHKELWANADKSENILSTRQYTAEEYDKREDLKFMVGYGEMKATNVRG